MKTKRDVVYGVTQPGDIWHLRGQGKHEVLCADNGDTQLIQHWFRMGQADLLVTSPPYAQPGGPTGDDG